MGCGSGRDSLHFLELGLKVTGIDASDTAISSLALRSRGNDNAKFICGDFVTCSSVYETHYDYIYSRFTLHAITDSQQHELLTNARHSLSGRLFIEARTIHDDIYGVGEKAGSHTFIHDSHFRRFIVPEELADEMKALNFRIIYFEESRGFSKTEISDPVLLRVIAE